MNDDTQIDEEPVIERPAPLLLQNCGLCITCGETLGPNESILCDDCERQAQEKNADAAEAQERKKAAERLAVFRESVGSYHDTDPTKLPDTAAYRAGSGHIIGGKKGITFSGPGSTGKTRTSVWVGRREMEAGLGVEFMNCAELRASVGHAKDVMHLPNVRRLSRVGFLILDDFGNHEFSRVGEELFLALLERRQMNGLRTAVTTQYTAAQLTAMMTTIQMADAICRRIGTEFNVLANTQDNTITP